MNTKYIVLVILLITTVRIELSAQIYSVNEAAKLSPVERNYIDYVKSEIPSPSEAYFIEYIKNKNILFSEEDFFTLQSYDPNDDWTIGGRSAPVDNSIYAVMLWGLLYVFYKKHKTRACCKCVNDK